MKNVAALALLAAIAIPRAALAADRIVPPAVPVDLQVSAGHKPILMGHAVGTQNYICAPGTAGFEWLGIGPQATVFNAYGQQILTHFASKNPSKNDIIQATWQHSGDTSAAWGNKLVGSTDSNFVAPDAIEWLLLEVTGARVGPAGGAKLATATLIQRVNTVGGLKPPASECTASTPNTRRFVSYEADYYFYE